MSLITNPIEALQESKELLIKELGRTQAEIKSQKESYDKAVKDEADAETSLEWDLLIAEKKYNKAEKEAKDKRDQRVADAKLSQEQAEVFINLHEARIPEIEEKIRNIEAIIVKVEQI